MCPPEVVGQRDHASTMGGCCSAAKSDGVELVGYAASGKAGDVSGEGRKRHILRYGGVNGKPALLMLTSFLLTKRVCRCPSQSTHPIPFSSAVHTASSCYTAPLRRPSLRDPFRVKAQVMYLSCDAPNDAEDPSSPPSCGQWVPVMKEAVFVALRCVKVNRSTSGVLEGQ